MMELNICASTRLSREVAKASRLPFLQPPAPSLSGVWTCDGAPACSVDEKTDDDIRFLHRGGTVAGRYTNELNTHVALADGRVGELRDGGYAIIWADGSAWARRDADVLVMVDPSVREGVIPKIERTLKMDRKAAKKKLAAAEAAGDAGGAAYFDNLQNALKVIMNALYGGLGSGKGGIFPESAPLASAITARGRSLICEVKQLVEQRFWLTPDGTCGGFEDEPRAPEAEPLEVLYGDTDSTMINFKTCSLQQAAAHGAALSAWFGRRVLKPPHVLEFEKVLFPCAFYKKKMYCANKYEGDYSETAKGKIFARGLSAVRRDNALIVKQTVTQAMDMMFKQRRSRSEVVAFCADALSAVHNSAVVVHEGPDRDFDGRLPFEAFVQSAGITKAVDDYDADNSATMIAKQMLELNPQCGVGKASRVTFVITARPGAKRCQQALLPSTAVSERARLDPEFYTTALLKKLAPLLSVLFSEGEQASRRVTSAFGETMVLQPDSKAARMRLIGEASAEQALLMEYKQRRVIAPRPELREPPAPLQRKEKKAKTAEDDPGQRKISSFFI
jgi:DNA polymerase elongation subunit (family B)